MKLLSLAIIAVSFAAAGFAIKHEAGVTISPATVHMEVAQEHTLPNRRTVREDAIIKKMDKIEHELIYLKGWADAQPR